MPNFPAINFATDYTLKYFGIGYIQTYFSTYSKGLDLSQLEKEYNSTLFWQDQMDKEIMQHIQGSKKDVLIDMFDYIEEIMSKVQFQHDYENIIEALIDSKNAHTSSEADLIDKNYLGQYLDLLDTVVSGYKSVTEKYLKRYRNNQIETLSSVTIPFSIPVKNVATDDAVNQNKKLKTALTAGQILYLFKTLKMIGVFETPISNIDLCRFIAANIATKKSDDLSADNLAKDWSNIDINDIAYWYDKFPEMSNQVIKDNPLRIKYKDLNKK